VAIYGEIQFGALPYGEEITPKNEEIETYKPDLMRYLPVLLCEFYYYESYPRCLC